MARAVTSAPEVCSSGVERKRRADYTAHRGGTTNMQFMVAKNLLFWGTISLSIYGLYAVVAAL
jgi:hypothetical protein